MRAMILAAGRGKRMRPLTDRTPKPLLPVHGRALIEWQISALVSAGINEIVINHAWLGEQIEKALGDGGRYGARIAYSSEDNALETLGGVVKALPLLGPEPFAVVSGDIYTNFAYARLKYVGQDIASGYPARAAHLVLTDNPPYHPEGDMGLADGLIVRAPPQLTYANIAVFHPRLFEGVPEGQAQALFPWMYRFVEEQRVSGEYFRGLWYNIGTPSELAQLDHALRTGTA